MGQYRGVTINIPTLGHRAHLTAWHRHHGEWWACLHWLEFTPDTGFGQRDTFVDNHLCVRGDLIEPVPGWDYRGVPRASNTQGSPP